MEKIVYTLRNKHCYDISDFANKAINEYHALPQGLLQNKITEDFDYSQII